MRLEPAPPGDVPAAPTAVPSASAVAEARRRRERAQWQGRRRLERQLHDGAALRASALVLQLGLFRHRVPEGEDELRAAIGMLQDELHAVLQELRDVAGQIYPPLLDEAGLGPALRELAERLDAPLRVHDDGMRFGPSAEGAVYFALADALTADPGSPREVTVAGSAGELVVTVTGAVPGLGELLRDRARPLGGTVREGVCDVSAPPDETVGTGTIVARIPCE
ncbi:histidine kinase [Pseudonocardia sp. RS11V-5]|uniref:sensor histidine kinase n=1 Tax=Pseudonocardia terrae TaxID=2905831 RepID=UPI001E4757FB|nr:histidine kinase [Pseudonocardia terrae]MCE3553842.1 histidine kinase [Pseudonocardia terrae]